jgi:hypothetical protein
MSTVSRHRYVRSFWKGFGDAFRLSAPATTKVIQHRSPSELAEALACEKADPRYRSHDVRAENDDLSTLVVRFRSAR